VGVDADFKAYKAELVSPADGRPEIRELLHGTTIATNRRNLHN
jgi:hypothetical protein